MRLADLEPRTVQLLGEPQKGGRKSRAEYAATFAARHPERVKELRRKTTLKRNLRRAIARILKIEKQIVAWGKELEGLK